MAVGLPQKFLDEQVTVEYLVDEYCNVTGRILLFNEKYVQLEANLRVYLIPWTAIAHIWIPKKKEIKRE